MMSDAMKVLKVGEYVHYMRNGSEHKGRIVSYSSCTCGLAGHVQCDCEGGTWSDHTIPLVAGHHAELVPESVFCLISSQANQPIGA